MNSPNKFTVVSTFSGCGGSSLGYQLAGGKVLLAVEWDQNSVETYRRNFPDTPVYHGDISQLGIQDCLQRTGLKPGELDIFDGSPLCQGFSIAGRRQFEDKRNQLFLEYVRLLKGLQPKVFVMENVSGMVKGKMKLIFAACLRELKASGYRVKARMLNTQYFQVPQSRERMIFIGVREDLNIEPSHPKPLTPPISTERALKGIVNQTFNRPLSTTGQALWSTLKPGQNGDHYKVNTYFNTIKVHPKKPSPTIMRTVSSGMGLLHWEEPRSLTIEELKRLASFPDEFKFFGPYHQQHARIGNSVPPYFMRAIACHLRDSILVQCSLNKETAA